MAWVSKLRKWLVTNWKYDHCVFCGEQKVPKDTQAIPRCEACDKGEVW